MTNLAAMIKLGLRPKLNANFVTMKPEPHIKPTKNAAHMIQMKVGNEDFIQLGRMHAQCEKVPDQKKALHCRALLLFFSLVLVLLKVRSCVVQASLGTTLTNIRFCGPLRTNFTAPCSLANSV